MRNGFKGTAGVSFLLFLVSATLLGWQITPSLGGPPMIKTFPATPPPPPGPSPQMMSLGKAIFSDVNLSNPPGQSCASCHAAAAGFKFPSAKINEISGIPPGAMKGRFENRLPPTISYAQYLPQGTPTFTGTVEAFTGGLFWDGRVPDLVSQAAQPFQNPNEMNNLLHNVGDPASVVQKLQSDANADLFRQVYGTQIFSQPTSVVFGDITAAIAAYESSDEVSPFSSKYDAYVHGAAKLTASEWKGLRLVTGTTNGRPGGPPYYKSAHCSDCHGIPQTNQYGPDIWTNSCYDNIGVPRNLANPYYFETNSATNPVGYNPLGLKYVDLGLGGTYYPDIYSLPPGNMGTGSDGQGDFLGINGDFKAPTLRNVDKRPYPGFVKRYTHNGFFTSLKQIVHFYNTRNLTTSPGEVIDFTADHPYKGLKGLPLWPEPEYPNQTTLQNPSGDFNSQGAQVGNLGLTDEEENDIIAFLKTLTDGYGLSYVPSHVAGSPQQTTPMQARNLPAQGALSAPLPMRK